MKYKGFLIKPSYTPGSHYRMPNDGSIIDRKPTSKDVEYYEIFDPMENDNRFMACDSIAECKQEIDSVLLKMNMKDNKQESWDKLS